MTKLEKLYSIIENSRDVGVKLPKGVLQQVEELEEGIIKEEILPKPHEPTKRIENVTKGMKVTVPDGTVIWHRQAIDTFIDALRKIGLKRVPAVLPSSNLLRALPLPIVSLLSCYRPAIPTISARYTYAYARPMLRLRYDIPTIAVVR